MLSSGFDVSIFCPRNTSSDQLSHRQLLKKQAETDNLVVDLYDNMLSAYDQASRGEVLQNRDELRHVYDSLFKHTIECSYFIQIYDKKSVTGMKYSLAKGLDSHITFIGRLLDRKLLDKAKEFSAGFEKLQHQLHHRIVAENFVVTLGIQRKVDELSTFFGIYTYLRAQSNLDRGSE